MDTGLRRRDGGGPNAALPEVVIAHRALNPSHSWLRGIAERVVHRPDPARSRIRNAASSWPAVAAAARVGWPANTRARLNSWLPSKNKNSSSSGVNQSEHDPQNLGAVRSVIDYVSELNNEAIGRGRIAEAPGFAVRHPPPRISPRQPEFAADPSPALG